MVSKDLLLGLIYVLFGLLTGLLIGGSVGAFFDRKSPKAAISLKPNKLSIGKAIFGGILGGLIAGLILGIAIEKSVGLNHLMSERLIGGLSIGLIGAVFGAVMGISKINLKSPIRFATLGGAFIGLSVGLVGIVIGLDENSIVGLIIGLTIGLIHGLTERLPGGLFYGDLDFVQHFTLRYIFYRGGYTPHHYAHFLNHATKLAFLQKVGRGYIFIHRLLQEHFANLPEGNERTEIEHRSTLRVQST